MKNNKQSQKAGRNSQLIQVNNYGVDEKRVREIFDELTARAIKSYAYEAVEEALRRNDIFKDIFLQRIKEEKAYKAFSDPSFQYLMQDAQKRAAMTERDIDYDILSELLIHRFKNPDNRAKKTSITKAIEVIDQITDEALQGLTVFHCVATLSPKASNIKDNLKILDDLFASIIYSELPLGTEWLEQLDLLNAIRLGQEGLGGIKSLEDFWYEQFDGLLKKGVHKGSEQYIEAVKVLKDAGINENTLKDTSDDYVSLNVVNRKRIRTDCFKETDKGQSLPLTENELVALEKVYDMYGDDKLSKECFIEMIDSYSNLKELRSWWNTLHSHSFQITSVGRVLAHSNAQRINKMIPPLD